MYAVLAERTSQTEYCVQVVVDIDAVGVRVAHLIIQLGTYNIIRCSA